jgi:hypothetical protein
MKAERHVVRQQRRQPPDRRDVRLDGGLTGRIVRLAIDGQQFAREVPLNGEVTAGMRRTMSSISAASASSKPGRTLSMSPGSGK